MKSVHSISFMEPIMYEIEKKNTFNIRYTRLRVFMGWVNPENPIKPIQKTNKNGLGWVIG